MTDNLTAEPKQSQRTPAEHKGQGAGQVSRQAAVNRQINHNNTAGRSVPSALHGKPGVNPNAHQQHPQHPAGRPVQNRTVQQSQQGREPIRGKAAVNIKPAQRRPAVSQPVPRKNVQNRPVTRQSAETRVVQQHHAPQHPAGATQPRRRPVQKAAPVKKQAAPQVKLPIKPFIIFGAILLVAGVLAAFLTFFIGEQSLIKKKVVVEIGTSANFSMFIESEPKYPEYLSTNLDFSSVDYSRLQSVFFTITLYGIDHNCELVIADTTAPKGEAVPQQLMSVDQIPDADKCITNIVDMTPVTVTWADKPDISEGGEYIANAKLTDAGGNETIVAVPLSVTKDTVPPVIEGYRDISIIVGETISYRNGIVLTDDYDKNPRLEIDTSGVTLNKVGDYKAVLKAFDFSGNMTEVTINVKIKAKPKNYIEPDKVYAEGKKIYEKITTPEMSDMEKALQIVWWVRQNIRFTVKIKPKSWTEGAYYGFKDRKGNCLTSASCVKVMLDIAGIENMFVTRWPYKVAKHYWNYVKIDGQWYHCDATWRQNYSSYFFMYTTKELLGFWHDGWNGFEFDQKKYPESATKSVQKKIDYKNHKIKS